MIKINMPGTVVCTLPGKDDQELEFFALGAPKGTIFLQREVVFTSVSQSMRRVDFDFSMNGTSISTFPDNSSSGCARKQWPRWHPNQLFDHEIRFPLPQIGVLRHPINDFARFSAVFSVECAHYRSKISGHDFGQPWLRMGSRISGLSWCDSPYQRRYRMPQR